MSRTTLCMGAAGFLAAAALTVMAARWVTLGDQVHHPRGPGTWKVTVVVQGKATAPSARIVCATPLDLGRQHVLKEQTRSDELDGRPAVERVPGRRELIWSPRPGTPPGSFRARYECYVTLRSAGGSPPTSPLYAAPKPGEYLGNEPLLEADHPDVASDARRLAVGAGTPSDQAAVLFQFVDEEIGNEPILAGTDRSAGECLRLRSGDPAAKARLLTALLRNRGIPARLAVGLPAARAEVQPAHVWVEAWVRDQWLPMCPFYHHYAHTPGYLLFGFGNSRLVRGHDARVQDVGFLVERTQPAPAGGENPTWLQRTFTRLSPTALPPAERRLVELLLLVPIGALIVCFFRQLVGLATFGTFAPALLGLAFRELYSLPGILIFASVLLVGWICRRQLDRFHLLQVPRTAVLLSVVICVMIAVVAGAAAVGVGVTRYISLFPMVILTGMVERFWTLEEEDSTAASFRTLLGTLAVAATISLALSCPPLTRTLTGYPEALGLVVAAQMLLGRYTGYRLSELWRFRDFLKRAGMPSDFPRVAGGPPTLGRF